MGSGFRVYGFRVDGFRVHRFRVHGFRVYGFRMRPRQSSHSRAGSRRWSSRTVCEFSFFFLTLVKAPARDVSFFFFTLVTGPSQGGGVR